MSESKHANRSLTKLRYMLHLFERLPNIDLNDSVAVDDLIPWSDKLPKQCRMYLEDITSNGS